VLAGLGWIGRNNLLVNEELGSQFRLASVLTNMPLKIDKPVKNGCGFVSFVLRFVHREQSKRAPQILII